VKNTNYEVAQIQLEKDDPPANNPQFERLAANCNWRVCCCGGTYECKALIGQPNGSRCTEFNCGVVNIIRKIMACKI